MTSLTWAGRPFTTLTLESTRKLDSPLSRYTVAEASCTSQHHLKQRVRPCR